MSTLAETVHALVTFRDHLTAIGLNEDTIADAIRIGGDQIPVFGSQLSGVYLSPAGERTAHHAVPGWYRIESVDGNIVRIRKDGPNCWPFLFGKQFLLAVLAPNLHYAEQGLKP